MLQAPLLTYRTPLLPILVTYTGSPYLPRRVYGERLHLKLPPLRNHTPTLAIQECEKGGGGGCSPGASGCVNVLYLLASQSARGGQ